MLLSFSSYFVKKFKEKFYDFSFFRICYIISLFFETTSFTNIYALWIKSFIIFWGFLICLDTLFYDQKKFEIKYKNIIIFFIILNILSCFINFSSYFLTNLVFAFHSVVCFFIFFGMNKNTEKKIIFLEMKIFLKFLIFASGIISALGLLVMFTKGSFKFFGYTLGIFNNRFLGVYTNSNLAGFVSATSVMACDLLNDKYFGNIKESKIKNFLFTIFLFFNIFSLFLTDSNASFVFITIYLVVRIFCESFAKYSSFKETKIFREILFISVCVSIIISSSFLIREFSQQTVNWILNKNDKKIFSIKLIENQDDLEKIHSDKIKIGRENYDVSSGRILLFKQGLILSKIRPLLGIGRGNLVRYAKIYIDGGLIFSDLHNSYLTIIVANGWIGFIIFMMFAISTIFRSARMVFSQNHKRKTKFLSKLFSILIAYFCYAIFEKCILSEITFMVIFLWIILGYISTVLESEHRS